MGDSFQPEWRKKQSNLQEIGKTVSNGNIERNNSSNSSGFSTVVKKNNFELSFPTLDPKGPNEVKIKQSVWSGADRSSSSDNSESDTSKPKPAPKQSKFTLIHGSMPNLKLARAQELERLQQQQTRNAAESSSQEKRPTIVVTPSEPKPAVPSPKSTHPPHKGFDFSIMKKASSDTLIKNSSRQEFLNTLKKNLGNTSSSSPSPAPKPDPVPSVPNDETKEETTPKEPLSVVSSDLSISSSPSPISIGSAEQMPHPKVDNLSVALEAKPKEEKKERKTDSNSTSSSSERDGVPKLKPNCSPKLVMKDRSNPFPSEVKNFPEGDENRLLQQLGWSPEDDNDIADEASTKVAAV